MQPLSAIAEAAFGLPSWLKLDSKHKLHSPYTRSTKAWQTNTQIGCSMHEQGTVL
jgi:hypothetical protein